MTHDRHDHEGGAHVRPSLRASFNNFRSYDAPFHAKIALVFRNHLIKLRSHSSCCGHYGEPGC
jgi:hypothetical protein